jgi:hypothetical protein
MRRTTKRAGQLALVTVAAPVAAWALEQAAHRAEARDQAGHHYHLERATAAARPASWLATATAPALGSRPWLLPHPQGIRPRYPRRPRRRSWSDPWR